MLIARFRRTDPPPVSFALISTLLLSSSGSSTGSSMGGRVVVKSCRSRTPRWRRRRGRGDRWIGGRVLDRGPEGAGDGLSVDRHRGDVAGSGLGEERGVGDGSDGRGHRREEQERVPDEQADEDRGPEPAREAAAAGRLARALRRCRFAAAPTVAVCSLARSRLSLPHLRPPPPPSSPPPPPPPLPPPSPSPSRPPPPPPLPPPLLSSLPPTPPPPISERYAQGCSRGSGRAAPHYTNHPLSYPSYPNPPCLPSLLPPPPPSPPPPSCRRSATSRPPPSPLPPPFAPRPPSPNLCPPLLPPPSPPRTRTDSSPSPPLLYLPHSLPSEQHPPP